MCHHPRFSLPPHMCFMCLLSPTEWHRWPGSHSNKHSVWDKCGPQFIWRQDEGVPSHLKGGDCVRWDSGKCGRGSLAAGKVMQLCTYKIIVMYWSLPLSVHVLVVRCRADGYYTYWWQSGVASCVLQHQVCQTRDGGSLVFSTTQQSWENMHRLVPLAVPSLCIYVHITSTSPPPPPRVLHLPQWATWLQGCVAVWTMN